MLLIQVFLQLLVASLIGGAATAQTAPPTPAVPARYFIENVPYTRQLPNYCGPAALTSLMNYWGVHVDQKTVAKGVFDRKTSSTNGGDLLLYARDKGLSAYSFNGTLSDLKEMVSKGYPVITLQEMSRTWRDGHYRVVVGFSDAKRTITFRDGVDTDYVTLSYSEFDYLWETRGRWALVAMPRAKDVYADTLGKKNAVLHMDLAQAYMRRGDFRSAETESRKALEDEPGNTYAKQMLSKARSHRN